MAKKNSLDFSQLIKEKTSIPTNALIDEKPVQTIKKDKKVKELNRVTWGGKLREDIVQELKFEAVRTKKKQIEIVEEALTAFLNVK